MPSIPVPGLRSDLGVTAGSKIVTGQEQAFVFGSNPNMIAATPADIWGGVGDYVFPSDSGELMEIVSDNAADVGMSILIQVLDDNFDRVNKAVTLNGITPVAISGLITRINGMINVSSSKFLGNLEIRQLGGGSVYSTASTEDQRATQCIYSVPRGFSAFNTQIAASLIQSTGGSTTCKVRFQLRLFGSVAQTIFKFGLQKKGTSLVSDRNQAPSMIPEKSDFIVRAESSDNSSEVSALIGLLLFADNRIK